MPTAEVTREQRVNDYCVLDAIAMIATNVILEDEGLHLVRESLGDDVSDLQELTREITSERWGRLWPDDEQLDRLEPRPADIRAQLLASALCSWLASDDGREALLEEARRLAAAASRNTRTLGSLVDA